MRQVAAAVILLLIVVGASAGAKGGISPTDIVPPSGHVQPCVGHEQQSHSKAYHLLPNACCTTSY